MKIKYDPQADALYIQFAKAQVATERIDEDIAIDYDQDKNVAGIEILDASKRIANFDEKNFLN